MPSATNNKHVIIVGGTRFQGRFLIPTLLSEGFKITVFHRGHTPLAMNGVTEVLGDRNSEQDLACLASGIAEKVDAVIDTCAYFAYQVNSLLDVLSDKTNQYTLVSSSAVYKNQSAKNREDSKLFTADPGEHGQLTPENYGALKAACEEAARENCQSGLLIVRPVILVGPGDHTHRMYFWSRLVQSLNLRLTLEDGNNHVMLLDVRDYANFLGKSIAGGNSGIYNVAPTGRSLNDLLGILADCHNIPENRKRMVSRQELARLTSHVTSIPYFMPEGSENFVAEKAAAAGLKTRSLESTVKDIHDKDLYKDGNDFRLKPLFESMLPLGEES